MQGWKHCGARLGGKVKPGWVGVVRSFDSKQSKGLHPSAAHFKFTSFPTRIFFVFYYKSSQGRGMKWGTGHRIQNSKGTVHLRHSVDITFHPLCPGQLSPTHGHRVNTCQAPLEWPKAMEWQGLPRTV